MRILRESRYAFTIECRFNELHFELFHGIFLLFHIHMELFSVDRLLQYSVVPPGVSPICKSGLIETEDMLQCLWCVIT